MIRSVLPQTLWTRGTGVVSAMFGIGTLVGPARGGVFAELNAWRAAFGVLAAFVMLCWLNALVLSIGIITASTVCGKCGMLFIVTESISVVNKPRG